MIPKNELNRRHLLRSLNRLDNIVETTEEFLKKSEIQELKSRRRGIWYKTKFGMQWNPGLITHE